MSNICPKVAAKITILKAEEIIPVGSLDSQHIHIPGIYINHVISTTTPKQIVILTTHPSGSTANLSVASNDTGKKDSVRSR